MENPPAKRALATLDNPPPAEIPKAPAKRVSKRVRAACDALVNGDVKTIKEAAEKVGMARESLSRALSTPHVAEHLRAKVLKSLAMAAARAGAVKVDLMDSDNAIARDRASTFILRQPVGEHQSRGEGGLCNYVGRAASNTAAHADNFP